MNKSMLYIISISCIFLSYAMEEPHKKPYSPPETLSLIEQVPKEILALILTKVVPQTTLEDALNNFLEVRKLRLVNKAFRDALPAYEFTIEKLAQRFQLPSRAIALRLIKALETKQAIADDQKSALLKKYPADKSLNLLLITTILFNSPDKVKELIQQNADVNTQSEIGITVLALATKKGLKEIVKLLIDAGADINAQNKDGKTALMIAIENGNKEIVDLLKQAGAKE